MQQERARKEQEHDLQLSIMKSQIAALGKMLSEQSALSILSAQSVPPARSPPLAQQAANLISSALATDTFSSSTAASPSAAFSNAQVTPLASPSIPLSAAGGGTPFVFGTGVSARFIFELEPVSETESSPAFLNIFNLQDLAPPSFGFAQTRTIAPVQVGVSSETQTPY